MSGVNERHRARNAWWLVRSRTERIHRFLDIVNGVDPLSNIYYKFGMLILRGWCSPLYCCTDSSGDIAWSFLSLFVLSCIQTCDLRVELTFAVNVVLSGRVVP